MLERARSYLKDNGIRFYELIDDRVKCGQRNKLGDKPVHCLRIDRMSDVIRLLTICRPSRFVGRKIFDDKKLPNTAIGFDAWARVESIKRIGFQDVVDIQTSIKTFVCEGLISHNSTYVEGRFFWRTTHGRGLKAFILTHLDEATASLFGMAKRYYENCPELIRPALTASKSPSGKS